MSMKFLNITISLVQLKIKKVYKFIIYFKQTPLKLICIKLRNFSLLFIKKFLIKK